MNTPTRGNSEPQAPISIHITNCPRRCEGLIISSQYSTCCRATRRIGEDLEVPWNEPILESRVVRLGWENINGEVVRLAIY